MYIWAGVIFLFGAAIFVHEFGHYWVALKRGLKVEEFAIGFGPKIVAWKRNGIEYSLRWIPAGGFVRLPQMITSTALEGGSNQEQVAVAAPVPAKALAAGAGASGQEQALAPTPAATNVVAASAIQKESKTVVEPIPPASALSKILVAVAGPAMNVVFAFALATVIYFVGLPVAVNPPIIGYVDPQSAEGKLGIHEDDRIVAINGQAVKSWDEIFRTTILALTNVFQVTIVRGGASNVYTLTADATNGMEVKTLNLDPKDHLVVGETMEGSAAAKVQLKAGDEILSLAGTAISSREELTKLIQSCGGKKTSLTIQRGSERLALEVTPGWDASNKKYLLGVIYAPGKDIYEIEHPTPLAQVQTVWDRLYGTIVALVHPRDSGVKASDLSGPVGIAGMLALEVKSDYRLALNFLVMLNINLAILNMLPIPVLDGGHIVMAILERIRRRPLEVRFMEYTTTVFAVLLISFMLYVTFFDIKRIPLIHGLFNRTTQIEQPTNNAGPVPSAQPAP
ncbi:MAG TPA: RIP metalloprotease RseP [Verrucomicrobiae bacterium]|nr:RIP metalloprotease RseP [Verrucomicrobiae bacterium]